MLDRVRLGSVIEGTVGDLHVANRR
jgi:hypothetical protein